LSGTALDENSLDFSHIKRWALLDDAGYPGANMRSRKTITAKIVFRVPAG
jgi:hypothetical protein